MQFAPVGFDIAHERWMVPLMRGAAIVLDDATQWPPEQLAREIERQDISVLFLPPAYMNQVLASGVRLRCAGCIVGGEAWLSRHAAQALEMLGQGHLVHAYGPTETVIAPPLAVPLSAEMLGNAAYAPIGRPVGARTAYVLDTAYEPGAARNRRRTVSGRSWAGARIPGPGRLDRHGLRARSLHGGPRRRTPLPDGGFRALPRGRHP